jgi:hypothetical protein
MASTYSIYPEKLVKNWEDCLPYTDPILTVKFDDTKYTSYDNRRLYSARWNRKKKKKDFTIACIVKNSSSLLPSAKSGFSMRSTNVFTMYWNATYEMAGAKYEGYYYLVCNPKTYGGAISIRSTQQGPDFSHEGERKTSKIRDENFKTQTDSIEYEKLVQGSDLESFEISRKYDISSIPNNSYFGFGRDPIFLFIHPSFNACIKNNNEWFNVISHGFYPSHTLEAHAENDEDYRFDDDFDEYLQKCDEQLLQNLLKEEKEC